jgi:hypothetical protein
MRGSGDVTPELLGHIQHRYEETDEPVASIAADCEVRERRIYEWVVQHGWRRRRNRPPLDLPPELRLSLDVDRALQETAAATSGSATSDPHPHRRRDAKAVDPPPQGEGNRARGTALPSTCDSPPDDAARAPTDTLSIAERLERQLEQNLARVERMREAQWPQTTADAERMTRALERLTDALLKVRRLRNSDTNMVDRNDFDMPRDIDEFRRALARRIDAFVRSRTGAGVPGPGAA